MLSQDLLKYVGKAKSLYVTEQPGELLCEFRDDASAFNGVKRAKLANKGKVNNFFNAFIMTTLEQAGIPTHFLALESETTSRVKALEMIPIECVIRNVAAGSIVKRLQLKKGQPLQPPVFEFFLKDDALGDPFINESHILTLKWADEADIARMKALTHKINQLLTPLFKEAGLLLVDYKLEFGRSNDQLVLGDEFTPDGCRIWDISSDKIMDKDRFRQDLGDVVETYIEVAERLKVPMRMECLS